MVQMKCGGGLVVIPMELRVKENQRYALKCDERQTANMIKFATCPRVLHHLRSGATALSPNLRASSSPATTGGEVRP